ncbi:GDSL esterase/lipase At1g29660-like [Lycium barbarum]|uniref:GDSL esterase/lipase At1g29660-like n=1 Tax=Lycium barbarum TaxID=112863 RepID=UPI00293F4970|nr:GDSL esterase/lipase At1g29660-like [Lycium barbarum]
MACYVAIITIFLVLNLAEGAPQVPCYFIFGDSLLDNGNNNDLKTAAKANYLPYGIDFPSGPTGRFSNGRNMADFLAEKLGFDRYSPPFASAKLGYELVQGVNYASGSAGIRNDTGSHLGYRIYLGKQLENHKVTINRLAYLLGSRTSAKKHLNKCLYVVGMGSNDYINNYLMPEKYASSLLYIPSQYATVLIDQYSQQLTELYEDGARKIALFGLPQIGCIPDQLKKHSTLLCVDSTNKAIQLFNQHLKTLVDDLNTKFPDAQFTYINMYGISSAIALTLLNTPCCKVNEAIPEGQCIPGKAPCLFRAAHFFYDNFHPTELGNSLSANRAYSALLPSDAYPMDIRHLVMGNKMYVDDQ